MIKFIYNLVMWKYYSIQLKLAIRKYRRAAQKHNLPSLDAYSDEAIVEGLKRWKVNKEIKCTHPNTKVV